MKNLTLTLLFSFFLIMGVTAQDMPVELESNSKFSIGLNIGASQSGTDLHSYGRHGVSLTEEANLMFGATAKYNLTPTLALRANFFQTKISGDDLNITEGPCYDADGNETTDDCHLDRGWNYSSPLTDIGLDIEWEFLGNKRFDGDNVFRKTFSPYALLGAGVILTDPEIDFSNRPLQGSEIALHAQDEETTGDPVLGFHAGLGLRFDLSEKIFVDLEARSNIPTNDLYDGISALTDNPSVTATEETISDDSYVLAFARVGLRLGGIGDDDGDGVNNNLDKCPQVPGLVTAMGCPDTDGDGIIDTNDACPNVAGVKRLDGCPDADGDNVADADDACPNVAGLVRFNGCPDSDGDGIADNEDDCPKVAGEKEFNGCLAPDTDGDGIADRDDKCPETPGTVMGCPDSDKDGIIDSEDKCPETPGIASEMGCPKKKVVVKPTITRPVLLTCETIYFNTNQSSVSNTTKDRYLDAKENIAIFERALAKLNENSSYRAVVQGHTDSRNTDEYNQKLSERRANEVLEGMISKGFPAARSSAIGFGESSPIATNDTKEGRAQNRRVEICIYDR